MIRNESEYKEAVIRLKEEKRNIDLQKAEFKKAGFAKEEVKRLIDPLLSFHYQLEEEVESYERLMRREFDELSNLRELGKLLIGLRIASGLSQTELASRLSVHTSQVSRDEKNEYHGVTVERADKILQALGARISMKCEVSDN